MPLKTTQDETPTLNMTPMIDVVFLLIIFFMVGARFTEMERKIGLSIPEVSQATALTPAPEKRVVNIFQDGNVTLDREEVDMNGLTNRLSAARSQYKDLGVLIRGDASVPLQRVAEVMSACKAAGIAELGISVRVAARER